MSKKSGKKIVTSAIAEAEPVFTGSVGPVNVAAPGQFPAIIESLWPGRVKVVTPGGKLYEWPDAGQSILVDAEDVEFVMGHNRSKRRVCCGGSGERMMFQHA